MVRVVDFVVEGRVVCFRRLLVWRVGFGVVAGGIVVVVVLKKILKIRIF